MSSQPNPTNAPGHDRARASAESHAGRHTSNHGEADIVDELGHGHSIAAWAGVGVCLVGFLILCLAIVFPSMTWGIIGGVVIVASLVVAGVLAKAGYGVKDSDGKPVGAGRPHR